MTDATKNIHHESASFVIPELKNANIEDGFIKLTFEDKTTGILAFEWLRDNCRCSECYDFIALSRAFNLDDLKDDLSPEKVWTQDGVLNITWNDLHQSVYEKEWIYIRGFISKGGEIYKNFQHLEKETWGTDLDIKTFQYEDLMNNEETIHEWLQTMEREGIALIRNAPPSVDSGADLIQKFSVVRKTQFGSNVEVKVEKDHRYPGLTERFLGLHTDICYYNDSAGIIFLHAVKQHEDKGGDSILVDGFNCAKQIKEKHPEAFQLLTSTDVYFWDKFNPSLHSCENRFKMNRIPIIKLNLNGEVNKITFNNNKRDTNIEITPDELDKFYEALKIFLNTIYDENNVFTYKMDPGDIVTLDNDRCMHGRKAFSGVSERNIVVTYLDWDEARSYRRLLQERIEGKQIYQ